MINISTLAVLISKYTGFMLIIINAAKKATSLPCGQYLVLRQRQRDPKMFFPA